MEAYTYQLQHDADGRIIEKTETVNGKAMKWAYAYDKKGRLREAHLNGRLVCQCHYDKQGRRSQDYFPRTHGRDIRRYEYRMDNRLMQAGNNGYTHDSQGFRAIWNNEGKYTTYKYAPDYRLLKVEKEDGGVTFQFAHDENGQRAAKYRNGEMVEAYQWLDFIRLAGFHDSDFGYRFVYEDEEARTPYAMQREDGPVAYLHYDQVGSLRVVADSSGNVIREILYDPFGGIMEDTNPDLRIPIGFAGGLHDRDLGFVRFGWRDYDTFTSRWTAPDPMGDAGGDDDWYGYCLDDPVNGNDPLGLIVQGLLVEAQALAPYAPGVFNWGMNTLNRTMQGIPSPVQWAWGNYKGYVSRQVKHMKDTRKAYYDRKEKEEIEKARKAKEDKQKLAKRTARQQAQRQEEAQAKREADAKNQRDNLDRVREMGRRSRDAIESGRSGYGGTGSNIGARGGSYNGYGR